MCRSGACEALYVGRSLGLPDRRRCGGVRRRTTDESACTPGSVHGRLAASRWAVIPLGLPLPAGSSGLPAGSGGQPSNACAGRRRTVVPFDLAPGGVYRATPVTRCAVVSYTAVSPLPAALPKQHRRRSVLCGTVPRVTPGRR